MSMVLRRVVAAIGVLLALHGGRASAAEPAVEVFTTSTLPVTNARDATVYYLDAIALLEQHLSLNLPQDPARAQQLVAQRIAALGPELESRTRSGAAGLARVVQLGLQQCFVWQLSLIFGDERRREGTAERIFDDLAIFGGAQQHTDGRTLVGLAHIPVERFQVELEFPEILRLEAVGFEFNRHQAVQAAMEEEKIERAIAATHL